MRLIKAATLELVDVWDDQVPHYAILSHRWTGEEITLGEFVLADNSTKAKSGWHKIAACAAQSIQDGYEFLWVDTCCIDKTSSAELSEAINSMYRWYQESAVCYVYLNDVKHPEAFSLDKDGKTAFEKSQWHTRGWTLQELLAPPTVSFFSTEWKRLGDASDPTVQAHLTKATEIEIDILSGKTPVYSAPLARRMSWAAKRQTTRVEDMAYCLLGIFEVNMPMLYGEGPKAFRRLQEEIMKSSKDQSLFAWTHAESDPELGGLLALHPRNFAHSADFEDKSVLKEFEGTEYTPTRDGIMLNLFLAKEQTTGKGNATDKTGDESVTQEDFYTAMLKCTEHDDSSRFPALRLVKRDNAYLRYKELELRQKRLVGKQQNILVRHHLPPRVVNNLKVEYIRIKFETNCPKASPVMTLRTKWALHPLFRTKALREAAAPVLASWEDRTLAHANVPEPEDQPALYKGEVPLRQLEIRAAHGRETLFHGMYEAGYDAPLNQLKWILPALPDKSIAYFRLILGAQVDPVEARIGTSLRGEVGFSCNHRGADGNKVTGIFTRPSSPRAGYSLYLRRNRFDKPTAAGEVAEIVLSLRHGDKNEPTPDAGDKWKHVAGKDLCPCSSGSGK